MRKQRGMTLIGWIIVLGMIAFLATVIMRLLPMYQEYYGVLQIMDGMETELENNKITKNQALSILYKRLDTGYVFNVGKDNIEILRGKNNVHISKIVIDYEVRKPFMAQIDFIGHFHTEIDVEQKK